MDKALPMNTGAEAVETAVKAARKWAYKVKRVPEGRAEIIVAAGNFAGRTTTIIGFSSEAQYRDGFGPFAPGFVSVPFGDADALEAAITPEHGRVPRRAGPGRGRHHRSAGGLPGACARDLHPARHPPDLRRGADRPRPHRRASGVRPRGHLPDGLILGKALGGGLLPVSAFLARDDVMAVFAPGDHGSTFGGNPLAAAVGEAALDLLVRERLSERARVRGDELLAKLRAIEHPAIAEVRGKGLLIGVEIDPAVASARTVCEGLLARGVLSKDTHGTVVRFAPPLVVESEHVDLAVGALTETLRSLPTPRRRLRRRAGRQRSANCATTPAKTAKPSQWLRRNARKHPSRVRVRISVKCQHAISAATARPAKYGQRIAEAARRRRPRSARYAA